MKITTSLKIALLALAGAVFSHSTQAATYTAGDLLMGFHATGGQGADTTFVFNLGSAVNYRNNSTLGSVFNINQQLEATFGENWFSRTDLYFGVFGNRTSSLAASTVNGDPQRTNYVSRETTGIATSTAWTGFNSNANASAGNSFQSLATAFGSTAAAANTDGRGVFLSTSLSNDWAQFNPQPGTGFNVFAGGIEANFGTGTDYAMVDLYRVLATNTGANPAGVIGTGSWETTFRIDDLGNITAVPEPSSTLLIALAGVFSFFIRNRRRAA